MAVIYTYPTKTNLASGDLVLISDSEDSNKTNNATISAVKDAIDVVDSIVAGTGISVSSATGNVTISTPAYSGGGNIGHVPAGGTSSNFLRGDGTWNTATIPLAADGTRGGIQLGYVENAKNYPVELSNEKAFVNVPWTDADTTYTAGTGITLAGTVFNANTVGAQSNLANSASSVSGRSYPIQTGAASGTTGSNHLIVNVPWTDTQRLAGVGLDLSGNTFNANVDGVNSVAAQTSSSTTARTYKVQVDSSDKLVVNVPWVANTVPIEGFNTFSIYSAPDEITVAAADPPRTIIRQSVCETDCTIGFVDFMRFANVDPISVFIYSGTISSASTASLKLSGSQAAPLASPTANSINTIQFKNSVGNPQTYNFSAGEDIVIVVSLSAGTPGGGGLSIAGNSKLLSNLIISRQNAEFMIPESFDNPNPPNNTLSDFLENSSAESPSSEGFALHFYNVP